MKLLAFFTILFAAGCNADISYQNCKSPLIKINQITQIPANGALNRDSNVNVKFTSTSTYTDKNMKASVTVNVEKYFLFGYITIPDFVFRIVAPSLEKVIPGIKYQGGKTFTVGCEASKKYLKTCPPTAGDYEINIDLQQAFDTIKSKAGAVSSWIGSGSYRVKATASLPDAGGKILACVNINAKVSI